MRGTANPAPTPRPAAATLYRWLPIAVFAFCAASFVLHPLSPIWTSVLADPDDYMRLNETVAWLKGQGWYDLSVPRISPGAHTVIHWSRLVDLPIAAAMLPLIKSFGMQKAALIASFIVPPLLFIALLFLAPALARPLVGPRSRLATALLLFAPSLLFNFTPGRVDHHAWQILIAGFGLLCLGRMRKEGGWHYAVFAAIAFACSLWIGTEALPWLMLFVFCLAAMAGWEGGVMLRRAALFGAVLLIATLLVLPLALPQAEFSSRALSWFSPAYVIFAALVTFMFELVWILSRWTGKRALRLALIAAAAFFAGMLFLYCVPEALNGPFADYDDFNSTTGLENIGEAMPLITAFHINPYHLSAWTVALAVFTRFLFLPLMALVAIGFALRTAHRRLRPIWLAYGVFLASALLLALFWQLRVVYFMQLFSLAPLTWLLAEAFNAINREYVKHGHWLTKPLIFLAFGPLPVIMAPMALGQPPDARDVILFPAARQENACDLGSAGEFLSRPAGYGAHIHTILSGANEGPELLFRTPHNVIAGNFDVPGNSDVFDFFSARDDKKPRALARKWHADLVLICRNIPAFYAGMDHPQFGKNLFLKPARDGKLRFFSSTDRPTLIEKLANNEPPLWLKPVEIPGDKDYLLYEIREQAK